LRQRVSRRDLKTHRRFVRSKVLRGVQLEVRGCLAFR
jgi:hypothetical protein